jgi:hypothetical protein
LKKFFIHRYGAPTPSIKSPYVQLTWHTKHEEDSCKLYFDGRLRKKGHPYLSVKEIYGDSVGGFLIGGSLKIASLCPQEIYGLWPIDELRTLDVIEHAAVMDPRVDYFMDSANVWYYGVRKGELYVFDTAFDELDSLGPIEQALEALMNEKESIRQEVRNEMNLKKRV